MFRKAYIIFIVLFLPLLVHGQGPREKAALKSINRQRWDKAYSSIEKALHKDRKNVPAYYLLSTYYFSKANPAFAVDSAYKYIQKAIAIWNGGDDHDRNRWSRFPLDSTVLVERRSQIDSAAFEEAKRKNTEATYSTFIETHPESSQKQTAIGLRYQVAFTAALEANTLEAFDRFLKTYPDAPQAMEARKKYDELLFYHSTRDRSVAGFESFIQANPDSPYRSLAEKSLFEIITAPGLPASFLDFLQRYPENRFRKQAIDMLFHILMERGELLPSEYMTDSLAAVAAQHKNYLVPILVKEKFGFMDSSGKIVVAPAYDEIVDEYICGDIAEDAIVLPGKMIDQKGNILIKGNISGIEDLGYGFMLVTADGKNILYHKGGYRTTDISPEDVRVLNGRILAVKNDGRWGTISFNGHILLPFQYQDITTIGDVLVLRQDRSFHLSTIDTVVSAVQGATPLIVKGFEEAKNIGGNILVSRENERGMFDQDLKQFVPLRVQEITPTFFGAVVQRGDSLSTFNFFGEQSENFSKINVVEPWVAAKSEQGWVLYNPEVRIYKSVPYDTLSLYGPFAVGKKKDGYELNLYKSERIINIASADNFEFLPGKDSVSYLVAKHSGKSTVYDMKGQILFTAAYDKIETAGNGYFIVSKKDKKGLLNKAGKVVVPVQYDAFGSNADDLISVLKSKKFGAYDVRRNQLIPPVYEKNIQRFGKNIFLGFKEGAYGFINEKNKPLSTFTFEEIRPWSDSLALVKQNGSYGIYNHHTKAFQLSGARSIKFIRDADEERLMIINKDGNFGVISSRRGTIIPVNFSDIVNVGSEERQLYQTEKHVQEASLFVVIYYDHSGKMIRREVYEQDEYERIYCDKN